MEKSESLENLDMKDFALKQTVSTDDLLIGIDENSNGIRTPASQFEKKGDLFREIAYEVQAAYGPSGTGGVTLHPNLSVGYYIQIGKLLIFRGQAVLNSSPMSYFFIMLPKGYSLKSINRSAAVSFQVSSTGNPSATSGVAFYNGDRISTGQSGSGSYFYFSGYYFID